MAAPPAPNDDPGPAAVVAPNHRSKDPATTADGITLKTVPLRHPGRWVAGVVLLVLGAMMVHSLAFSEVERGGKLQPRFQWGIVGQYLLTERVLRGLLVTLELTAVAMAIGIVLGVVLAVMRLSPNPILTTVSWLYIWFFRGTPVLVQLLFWYNIAYVFPQFTLGVPFGPSFLTVNLNTVPVFLIAGIGLGLNEGAYMAEIVRAGIISVDDGQVEAAQSIGMRRVQTLRLVVLPQAMRLIIPPTGNEVISMLKTSSLAYAIALPELLGAVANIYATTYETIPLLMVASIWYLAVTSVLTVGQFFVERRYSRGAARPNMPWLWRKLMKNLALRARPYALGEDAIYNQVQRPHG
jgi:polar amino acid transport system permease protein